jgi:hypothetical protein
MGDVKESDEYEPLCGNAEEYLAMFYEEPVKPEPCTECHSGQSGAEMIATNPGDDSAEEFVSAIEPDESTEISYDRTHYRIEPIPERCTETRETFRFVKR